MARTVRPCKRLPIPAALRSEIRPKGDQQRRADGLWCAAIAEAFERSEPAMTALSAVPSPSPDFLTLSRQAADEAAALVAEATRRVRARVVADGRLSADRLQAEQQAAHGLAWLTTYATSVRELAAFAERMSHEGRFGETEELLTRIGLGEYLDQMFGGIPMSQGEIVRPHALGLGSRDVARFRTEAIETLIEEGNTPRNRARLVELIRASQGAPTIGDAGLDETLEAIRTEMRRFGEAEVAPHAHEWHLANAYIPLEIVGHMAELGVFGLTIPEEYGGLGLSKVSMCVVSEELSRAYIGVGSLGTR